MKLLVGTSNPGKFREFVDLLSLPTLQICSLVDFPDLPLAAEDGDTFLANARLKARHYSRATGLVTVADDSGLEVEALGGDPGVRSARFAGDGAGDRANIGEVLRRLERTTGRSSGSCPPECAGYRLLSPARFVCALSLHAPGREIASAEGVCHGFITAEPRGSNGFGYDPLFFYPARQRTLAELSADEKCRVSHRGQAVRRLREFLLEHQEIPD